MLNEAPETITFRARSLARSPYLSTYTGCVCLLADGRIGRRGSIRGSSRWHRGILPFVSETGEHFSVDTRKVGIVAVYELKKN
jgi:hypothetical protein